MRVVELDCLPSDSASRNGSTRNAPGVTLQRVIVLGYITAIGMPPIGLVLGIVLAVGSARLRSRHGLAIIAASIVGVLIWIVIVSSGTLSSTDQSY
jgi:hypothetical protein